MTRRRHDRMVGVLFVMFLAGARGLHAQMVTTPHAGVPAALPGVVEAENFDDGGEGIAFHDASAGNSGGAYRVTDVDLEETGDAGGGYNVGWVSAREWLNYTVEVATAGPYMIQVRVASAGAGGTFHLEVNGSPVTGALAVPDTGNWQNWTTVGWSAVPLASGIQVLQLVMDTAGSSSAVGNFNWLSATPESVAVSAPYSGRPVALPGVVEAENFDNGGERIAYHDGSEGNSGGAYRMTDVDLEGTGDAGGGYNAGWVSAGEWWNYTVDVMTAGVYAIGVRVASPGAGGTFHLEVNGSPVTGALAVPDTGGWQTWTTVSWPAVPLASGIQVLRLAMDSVGSSSAVGNFNWLSVTPESVVVSEPFGGRPVALPGVVEAENFDNGGEGIAYHDGSEGNSGGAYRATDVDIEGTGDAGGGHNVAWVSADEWLNYTVEVAAAGVYTIGVRVASPGAGGTFHLEVNGSPVTGPLAVPDTGGWQNWTTVGWSAVPLASGVQVWRLAMDSVGSSSAVGNFNWLQVQPEAAASFRITAPVPASTLRTTTITVRWEGAGDEFWLKIGSAPGSEDIYATASIGQATERAVSHLPLNGRTLYLEVIRRIGSSYDSVKAQYTAPVRTGLAIITDFSNHRLEDWGGGGMKNIDDVSVQLRKMEDHWAWLSRGLEKFRWDIIRVQLPQTLSPEAFSGWNEFRNAVITLARQQVGTDDYDVNSDAVIDASWLIVSSGDVDLPYGIGGSSQNAGANVFVDGQASGSVQFGATGNFNHELGHLLGLVDMYGLFGTMSSLTLMSYSWPVPPPDFSAYERIKLGWLTPQVVRQATQGVWLPSANDQLAAVVVPTNRPSEYFIIEYRRRPSSGYGSADTDFNGLAIYHVLEGSSMSQNPPIMKLEPADGHIQPSQPADPNDFLSPDNPFVVYPMILSSYFGDGAEVFRINNVTWRDGGLAFDLTISGSQPPAPNLLANSSFETGQKGLPDRWSTGSYLPAPTGFVWPSPTASAGTFSALLTTSSDNDMNWHQTVSTLVPGETYLLCGWLKGEQIGGSGNVGANVSLLGGFVQSQGSLGTFDWTQSCVPFVPETPSVEVACRLGFYGSTNSGNVWCDDFTLHHLRSAF